MSEKVVKTVENNMAKRETICRTERSVEEEGAPSGHLEKLSGGLPGLDPAGDIEQLERKRKTRRRKTKRKNPYNKIPVNRGKKPLKARGVNQPDAPYNTNQFLIEDHNDLQDFDVKLMAVTAANRAENQNGAETQRTGRQRDPSFTSAESDQEFYSSPEDEEEFLTKEFSNTYRDVHVESLGAMTKNDLIQTVLQLEEKIDSLEKRLGKCGSSEEKDKDLTPIEKEKYFQSEICKLVHANEELINENEKLRQQTRRLTSESSEDSESDSSSSSESSEMSHSENDDSKNYEHMNGDMECEPDVNLGPANVT